MSRAPAVDVDRLTANESSVGENVRDISENVLSGWQSHEYGYTVRQDKPTEFNPGPLGEDPPRYTQTWRNSLTFTVPNEQPLIVQYRYKVFGNPQAWVEPDNNTRPPAPCSCAA